MRTAGMKFWPPKPGTLGSSLPVLFVIYICLAFAVLGANPFKGQTITPFDVLIKQRAWSWMDPGIKPRHTERTDVLNGFVPYWTNAREQVRAGQFPIWNDDAGGGVPLVLPNSRIYTPGFLIFAAAPSPAVGFHLAIVFNLAIAGLGMHLFLRRRLGWLAAALGGATFMFCGFHAAWLYWAHVFTSMWAPWLLLAIDRCAAEPRMRNSMGIAAATAMLVLGGFPFVGEVILCMGALYFVVQWTRRWRTTGDLSKLAIWYVCGSVFGMLLCSPLLLEFMAWLQQFDIGYRNNRGSYLDSSYISRLAPPWAYEYKRVEQTMYVGLAMTVLAAGAIVATFARGRRGSDLPLFGVLLLTVSSGLVFGLWPMWLIGWFPGMSFNSWSRAICILDIALIILGACAFDRAWKWTSQRPSRALQVLLVIVAAGQVAEISVFFHRYNGAVPRRYYYPEIPATAYLRQHSGPFDYVVSDDSFGISGELGAYGLRDWFTHQFRTPALQEALRELVPKHFSSHTSSRFESGDIHATSPLMATMNVRYLAVSSTQPGGIGPGTTAPKKHRPLPSMPAHDWYQHFSPEQPMLLAGISVRLATYRRSDLEGSVQLELRDSTNKELARAEIDARYLVDNAYADFYFPRPIMLAKGSYGFSLVYAPPSGTQPRRLTAWATESEAPESGLLVDGSPSPGVMEYLLHPGTGARGPFQRVFTGAGISVYENTSSPDGPYFVGSLDDIPDARSGRHVRLEKYAPARFVMRYSGGESGFVVVPTSVSSEWAVTVNGEPTKTKTMAGVMPAVPVEGPATIRFEYKPGVARWLAGWLASLVGFLLVMWLVDRWLGKRRHAGGNVSA
jgi:hypothetical protein